MILFPTSPSRCFCTTWETKKSVNLTHFSCYMLVFWFWYENGQNIWFRNKMFLPLSQYSTQNDQVYTLSAWDQTEENISKPSAVYAFNFQQVANGVSCYEWWKYLWPCICAQGRKFEIYFRLCTAWGNPIFSVDEMCRFDVWLTKGYSRMTRKWIKFDLFGFKFFPQVVQKHQLGELRNKMTPSSCIFSGIFLSKIIKIEQCLTILRLMFYFDSRCM